jgi:hypothetical protein
MGAQPLSRGFRHGILALAAGAGASALASCRATEEAPRGRLVSPAEQAPILAPVSWSELMRPPRDRPLKPGLTELDREIADDPVSRPWSKNVPRRACTKDDECGDGFCDRMGCAPIWTAEQRYGQRCGAFYDGSPCGSYLCIEGRCRSCLSHAECDHGGVCGIKETVSERLGNLCFGGLGPHEVRLPPEPPPPVRLPASSGAPLP